MQTSYKIKCDIDKKAIKSNSSVSLPKQLFVLGLLIICIEGTKVNIIKGSVIKLSLSSGCTSSLNYYVSKLLTHTTVLSLLKISTEFNTRELLALPVLQYSINVNFHPHTK